MNNNANKIGVLWKNEKQNNNSKTSVWYNGVITCPHCQGETKIIEFHNFEKLNDNSPDKTIYKKMTKDEYLSQAKPPTQDNPEGIDTQDDSSLTEKELIEIRLKQKGKT